LFTDPIIVNGPLTNAEIEGRSSAGFYLFVPRQQEFLCVASRVAKEDRLSRFVFVAEKPS
jgi:hypothetical protein